MDSHYSLQQISRMGSAIIRSGTTDDLQEFYQDRILGTKGVKYDNEYLFNIYFKNACLYGKQDMIELLSDFYAKELSVMGQIGLNQMFAYCRVTIQRNHPQISKWFETEIMGKKLKIPKTTEKRISF